MVGAVGMVDVGTVDTSVHVVVDTMVDVVVDTSVHVMRMDSRKWWWQLFAGLAPTAVAL